MKIDSKMNLAVLGSIMLALGSHMVHGCSYSTLYSLYDRCDGVPCSSGINCSSNTCVGGYCSSELPPWAIVLIVIFVVFFVASLAAACRRRRMKRLIILRNQAALIRHNSSASSDAHHHHHHNPHHHDTTPKTIITGATQVPQVPVGPIGYAPVPQPML